MISASAAAPTEAVTCSGLPGSRAAHGSNTCIAPVAGLQGGRAEAVRVPYAEGALVKLLISTDSELLATLAT